MSASVAAGAMPKLDAFDQEFECDQADSIKDLRPRTGLRFSTLMLLALIAGIISALVFAWSNTLATLNDASSEEAAEKPEAVIAHLVREVDSLKKQVRDLTSAQRQAADIIAGLRSEQEARATATAWYSDPNALTYGLTVQADASVGIPTSRRPAGVRTRPREAPRRDDVTPLSLEPPQ
jgi:cell division protein FtsB